MAHNNIDPETHQRSNQTTYPTRDGIAGKTHTVLSDNMVWMIMTMSEFSPCRSWNESFKKLNDIFYEIWNFRANGFWKNTAGRMIQYGVTYNLNLLSVANIIWCILHPIKWINAYGTIKKYLVTITTMQLFIYLMIPTLC